MKYEQWLTWAAEGFRKLFSPPPEKPPQTFVELATEWHELDEQRLAHGRLAKSVERQQESLEEKVAELVRTACDQQKVLNESGFLAYFERVRGSVAWRKEFERAKSPQEAEQLVQAQPYKDKLRIERAA